ncbi:MAG: HAMP domain-containing histidine kinase [Alphaproteobacteria bacterium]|nr:HAMP domain-containing histidine kinase [Alphaproteobacteria bacterium]
MNRVILPLRSWLVLSHLTVLLLPLAALLGTGALAKDLLMQTKGDLMNQAALIGLMVEHELLDERALAPRATVADVGGRLSLLARKSRESTLAGVRILDTEGVVVATSGDQLGEDLSDLPEVQEALAGASGTMVRPRDPPSQRQPLSSPSRRARVRLFLTWPVYVDGEFAAVVLLSRTPREELQALYHMAPRLGGGLLSAVLITLGLGLWSANLFSRSLKKLSRGARLIARGSRGAVHTLDQVRHSHVREVGEVADAVTTMTRTLQSRLSYISEFAGNVSHEFKTPLSTLRGTVELLREDDSMPAEQQAIFLDNANDELDRLERMVTGLLQLARAEEGSRHTRMELDALVDRLCARYPELRRSGQAGAVNGDAAQLDTVLVNLVENAFQHGGEGVSVQVVGWVEGGWTGVDIVDDGPGISAGNLPRVFDRFFTTDRQGGGTGLGLALVRAVCVAHGGEVELESAPGRTRFRVRLPMAGGASLATLSGEM